MSQNPLLRILQNLLALLAAALVAGALAPWPYRLACAIGAIGVAVALAVVQFQSMARKRKAVQVDDTYARIARIRADRAERFKRRR